jgi:hypothetical protein
MEGDLGMPAGRAVTGKHHQDLRSRLSRAAWQYRPSSRPRLPSRQARLDLQPAHTNAKTPADSGRVVHSPRRSAIRGIAACLQRLPLIVVHSVKRLDRKRCRF